MGTESSERERALEERVAQLELRLSRLESTAGAPTGAVGTVPSPSSALPVAHATDASIPVMPTRVSPAPEGDPGPPPPRSPYRVAPWQDPAGGTSGGDPAAAVPTYATPYTGPTGPTPRGPSIHLPSQIRWPDLSARINDLEARLTGRALAWVGGLAIVLGMIF